MGARSPYIRQPLYITNKERLPNRKSILFQVPVYRETGPEFYEVLRKKRDKTQEQLIEERRMHDEAGADELITWYNAHPIPDNPDRIAWNYNRIVGWIVFYADGMFVKADLWLARGRSIPSHFRRLTIDYRSKLGDVSLIPLPDNDQLRGSIREFLTDCAAGKYWKRFKNYHFETDQFYRQLQNTDIRAMMEEIQNERVRDV